jgi:hypothetical protein
MIWRSLCKFSVWLGGWSCFFKLMVCRTKYPDAPGRLILQDLPHVIDSIQELHPKVERMKHDFYTEQPVKGVLESIRADTYAGTGS